MKKRKPAGVESTLDEAIPEAEGSEALAAAEVEEVVTMEEILEEVVAEGSGEEPRAENPEAALPGESAGAPEEGGEAALGLALKRIVEAVLFASQKPVSSKELIAVFKGAADMEKEKPSSPTLAFAKVKAPQILTAIEELELDCADARCTHEVRETAAGWQLVTKPEFTSWLRQLYPENRSARLSAPALETLAIIAYRQPITRADIEAVRGVAVDGVMQTLLDRSLVKIAGRADVPGRPLLYETTQYFMEHFGLKDLEDLPNASELRTISLPKAEVPEEEAPAKTGEEGGGTAEAVAASASPEQNGKEAEAAEPMTEEPGVSSEEEVSVDESDPVVSDQTVTDLPEAIAEKSDENEVTEARLEAVTEAVTEEDR